MCRAYESRPEWLRENQRVARAAAGIAHDLVWVDLPDHAKTVDGLGVLDGVAAGNGDARLRRFLNTAEQNGRHHLKRQLVLREAADRQRHQGGCAHGVDVAQRVGRRDRAIRVGVVDDGSEDVDGRHHREVVADAVSGRVIKPPAGDEVLVLHGRQRAQDLREGIGAQFRRSAGARSHGRQPDLLRCHAFLPVTARRRSGAARPADRPATARPSVPSGWPGNSG